jgi:hypothetical protein
MECSTTPSADKAIFQAWMECRLQRHQQTKQCFRPGWNAGSNGISRQSNASGLDRMQASKSADKEMLQVWMERRLHHQHIMQCNASGLDGMVTPTQQIKQCFRPEWNGDSNKADKEILQAWMERRL